MTSHALPQLTPAPPAGPRPPRPRKGRLVLRIVPPPREIDWVRVGVWAGGLVASCVVWGGMAVAIASMVG